MMNNLLKRLTSRAAYSTKIRSATTFIATTGAALTLSTSLIAAEIPLLNHNFDSDAIPLNPGYTTSVSGWVHVESNQVGVTAPQGDGEAYHDMGNRGQVAYIWHSGRINQKTKANLVDGETYNLTFDIGQSLANSLQHFVVRFKANGLVLAQKSISEFNVTPGHWTTASFSFTANQNMPIGEPLVIEFQNLATSGLAQVDIDNVYLTTEGTVPTDPTDESISKLSIITQNKTLLVPSQYPNINAALRYLDDKQIKVGKTVTIQVTDCTNQVYNESINVAHPNGNAIHIIGNVDSPESCVLQFNDSHGIVVQNNNALGLIDGFTINGNRTTATVGLSAKLGALIRTGSNLITSNFEHCVLAEHNGTVLATSLVVRNCLSIGFFATKDSYILAKNASSEANRDGFYATLNSTIEAIESTAANNSRFGFATLVGSTTHVYKATALNNQTGFYAWSNATVHASHAHSAHNSEFGFYGNVSSFIYAGDSTTESNGTNYSPDPNTENSIYSFISK